MYKGFCVRHTVHNKQHIQATINAHQIYTRTRPQQFITQKGIIGKVVLQKSISQEVIPPTVVGHLAVPHPIVGYSMAGHSLENYPLVPQQVILHQSSF